MTYASRHGYYLAGSVAAFVQVLADWWDVYSHLLFRGLDPWWNPAHLTLYASVAITIFVVWQGLRVSRTRPVPLVSPIRFVNEAGMKLAGLGCIIEIVAVIWNEIVHHVFRVEPRIAPAHAMLTVGMLTINLGIVVGLTVEYGMIRRGFIVVTQEMRRVTASCELLTFSAIWLAASGFFIYVGGAYPSIVLLNWTAAALIAFTGTLVLVCAKKAVPKLGTTIAIGGIFNAVTYFFLVAYVGEAPYVPWAFVPLALFDIIATSLAKVTKFSWALLVASLVVGTLFWATYFPFTAYLFPWSSLWLLPNFLVIVGSLVGAWSGFRVFARVSALVLGDVATA
ncbi:MAG TPA: hypothetical protein VLV18_03470 [Terriglobales bacterium]|nr:hypothetical protein [Terriglobales bacterium]